jgi:hypothetical protein
VRKKNPGIFVLEDKYAKLSTPNIKKNKEKWYIKEIKEE